MRRILLSTLFILLPMIIGAQTLPGDSSVLKGRLANGLTYYIVHNELPAQRAGFYLDNLKKERPTLKFRQ